VNTDAGAIKLHPVNIPLNALVMNAEISPTDPEAEARCGFGDSEQN
jgi:hypothetical protein